MSSKPLTSSVNKSQKSAVLEEVAVVTVDRSSFGRGFAEEELGANDVDGWLEGA